MCDEILYSSDHTLHLHNKFICGIAFNSARDSPEPGIAAWVTAATDKNASSSGSKGVAINDAGEQRLKKEVMAIPGRDRRRIKSATTDEDIVRSEYEETYLASRIKVPEVAPTSAVGLTKTNWEPEIKKRYQQPLFVETSEFPDIANVYARMVPICYEEAIPQGANMQCAEFVVNSAEFFLKDFLGNVFDRVRANGPRYENGIGGGVFTSRYQKQLYNEIGAIKAGKLQRTRDDEMLPVESSAATNRKPLSLSDFKLADRVGSCLWTRAPLLDLDVETKPADTEYDDWKHEHRAENETHEDEMNVDDFDWDAEGYGGRGELDSLLGSCLTVGG